jgi:plastocyanin
MRNWPTLALAIVLTAPFTLVATVEANATEYSVVIENLKFGPLPADLHVGDVIVWQNKDLFRHTATARDDSFDVDLPAGAEGKMTLEHAGTFDFFCRFHPGMTGTLAVSP